MEKTMPANTATVLTIEDDADVRLTIRTYLSDSGFTVLEAPDGQAGLEIFRRERPDLVLTDLRQPALDGLAVISTLQAENPDTPVIMVSGSGRLEDAIEAVRRGAWDYVTKPISDMALLELAIVRALERARRLRETRRRQAYLEQAVQERTAELEQLNAELEQRVAARTEELSLANTALARAARLKDEFLANMSHELRTPLTGILGMAEVLQMDSDEPLTEPQRRSLNSIQQSGEHLLQLINDILDLSKVEAGKLDLSRAPVLVDEICQASLHMIREAAARKGLHVSYVLAPDVKQVLADERRLKQMLVNLLSNAAKFTPAGGSLGLEVAGDAVRQEVRWTVWDTGIGVAAADQARVFQPFVQLDSSLSRQYPGTGLGLSLVARLAELHGGRVELESEGIPGRGSRFTVVLPWSEATPRHEEPPAAGPTGLRRALIVEDASAQAERFSWALGELGWESTVLNQGSGVLEAAAAGQPDVILLDLLLPDRPGWEVLFDLKRDRRTRSIPVIVASVLEERERAETLGADAYLLKPVAISDLQRAIDQTRARRSLLGTAAPAAATDEPKPLILVAEDNELNATTIQHLLAALGYTETAVARNGREALAMMRAWRPALVLMDIQMPEMDGLAALRTLRADPDPKLAATPVIAVTALAMVGDRERCLAAGANDYVAKPVNSAELKQKLSQWLK